MFVVEQLHDEIRGLKEIVLFLLGNPKLRLNLSHALGQSHIIRFPRIHQMPECDMAHFTAALTGIIHRKPPPQLLVLSLDRNAHSRQQGSARFAQHRIHRIQGIGVDEIVNE